MSESQDTTLIESEGNQQALANLLGHLGRQSVDNFGDDPQERMRLEFACQSSSCLSVADQVGKVVAVRHYYLHPVEIVDGDTVEQAVRTVLVTPAGTCLQAVSEGVAKVAAMLGKYHGRQPCDPPVYLRAVKLKGRRGDFLTFDIEGVDPNDDVAVDIP